LSVLVSNPSLLNMKATLIGLVLVSLLAFASATAYFQEDFDDSWTGRWVYSTVDDDAGTAGKFVHTPGKYFNDAEKDEGIQTAQDAKFYKLTAKFPQFSNKDKPLVIQYSVKHEQTQDCGGAYIKVGPPGLDQESFTGESQYNIMFGPDVCGFTKRVHFILNYKGENHLIKREVKPETDVFTHLYTAILYPNQTYEIRIDNEQKQHGAVVDDWDLLPPKQIPDPSVSKPADWVDEEYIDDPDAKKPEDWDSIPRQIPDPDAQKPEDWDDELDGEWETPMIANPEYKGEWRAPRIKNPAYKGPWEHPLIDNPDYKPDPSIGVYEHGYVGFEIWQVKTGTLFDHILITDDLAEAEAFAEGYFEQQQEGEKAAHEKQEEERRQKEEEERKKHEAETGDDEDEDDEDEDDGDDHHGHDHDDL
jgi:calreticulin